MKNSLIWAMLTFSLLTSPVYANQEQTQAHLKALLGELLQLEQQLEASPKTDDFIAAGAKYLIKPGDSLKNIAHRAYGKTNIKLSLVMQLIISKNPTAFFRNNANYIYADKTISIPSVDDFRTMLFAGEADSLLENDADRTQWIRFP